MQGDIKTCHVLYPGAFKPVHCGHISLMEKYLNNKDYLVKLIVIISKSPREGISADSSKWFLDQVFKGNPNVEIRISPDPSPIKTVYDIIGTAAEGDGMYAMGASAKGTDIKRAENIERQFAEGGKYYTPGVQVIFFPVNPEPLVYTRRADLPIDTPISSTIVRNDIRNNNYDLFRTAYLPLLEKKVVDEDVIKTYFDMLSTEILPIEKNVINSSLHEELTSFYSSADILNEGGAAGHMSHPYDYDDFTFADLKLLISDLFTGNITDVTEKLDGQNLFASVDDHGNTIFARNNKTLKDQPWYLEDIMYNPKWTGNPSVQHAFSNAAVTIDKIFKNINDRESFFNYDDKAAGIKYRYWLDLEIIDTENFNVIPYADSKVSFHKFVVTSFEYSDGSSDHSVWNKFDMTEEENSKKMEIVKAAIAKTNRTTFKAQVTPEVIFKKLEDGAAKAEKYISYIDKMLDAVAISDKIRISDYKELSLMKYLETSKRLYWIDGDVLDALISRWIYGNKQPDIKTIYKTFRLSSGNTMTKEQYDIIREFENDKEHGKDAAIKKIMRPLDTLFMRVGNEIISRMEGFTNAGHEKEIIDTLRSSVKDIRFAVEHTGDNKQRIKLEQSLARLADINNELNATEGIVFKWKDKVMKLTGAFAPLNQILGCGFKSLAEK